MSFHILRRLARPAALLTLAAASLQPLSGQTTSAAPAPATVGSVETDTVVRGIVGADGTRMAAAVEAGAPLPAPTRSAQAVSSIVFAQVYTPFVWGRTSVGGLSVAITLEDSAGNTKGVALQTTKTAPNNVVKVDRTQLYFETVFVEPTGSTTRPNVNIMPGDRVRVVTTGVDPATGGNASDDRRVIVDDVRAWTSLEQDRVGGIAPAGSSVTVTTNGVNLAAYLTPGSSMTYADVTAGGDGTFSASSFRTTLSATGKTNDFTQGNSGFVRARHADGNEVYTVHGQNVFVLENSSVLHGYGWTLPTAPSGLETGVTVTRPTPTATAVLKTSAGQTKDSQVKTITTNPYTVAFASPITAGDVVEVSVFGAPATQVTASRLTAAAQLGNNTVSGSGPANTQLVVGAAKLQGYMMATGTIDYLQQRVTADGSGNFSTAQFTCGTNNYLAFKPGSFGYVGFEDSRGNFVYSAFAAPTNHVMSDYPYMEGFIADGSIRPSVTIRGADGTVKQQTTADPTLLWLTSQKLYLNVYYGLDTSAFILPGDKVDVTSGAWSSTINVDKVVAWLDTDGNAVTGEAPAGASLKAIPSTDRASRRELTVGGDGRFRADNPYLSNSSSCSDSTKTIDFKPGDSGRVYVTHPDGNQVFASYGRAIHVNQNENYVELYLFPLRDIDWDTTPQRTATVTLTPRLGTPTVLQVKADFGRPNKTRVNFLDGQGQRVLIRTGDSISATFDEGPGTVTRATTIELAAQSLVTGSPDVDTNTLGGVGPRGWSGLATLNSPPTSNPSNLSPTGTSAYGATRFATSAGATVPLVRGYSGTVSFSNTTGGRVWTAWAVAAVPVKITGMPVPGDTRICGSGPVSTPVRIHDVTNDGQDTNLGSGSIGTDGLFCVDVPALTKGQVVLAEADGVYSQPVVVGGGNRLFIAHVTRNI